MTMTLPSISKDAIHVDEIDYLRGLGVLAVLVIHTSANFTRVPTLCTISVINIILDVFANFAVPLFIFISGFVLHIKYYGCFSIISFYENRIKSIIPPYLIFSFAYLILPLFPINTLYYSFSKSTILELFVEFPDINKILIGVLTGTTWFHLWFFVLIIQIYLLYPLIVKIYDKFLDKKLFKLFIVLIYILQVACEPFLFILKTKICLPYITFIAKYFYLPLYIYYLILGMYASDNFEKIKSSGVGNKKLELAFFIVIFTAVKSYLWIYGMYYGDLYEIYPYLKIVTIIIDPIYYSFIFAIFIFTSKILVQKESVHSTIIFELGKFSFGIYLVHGVYLYIILDLFEMISIYPTDIIFYPLLFILMISLSYISVYSVSRLPFSKLIIGYQRTK